MTSLVPNFINVSVENFFHYILPRFTKTNNFMKVFNKKRSRTAIFSDKGAQKTLIEHPTNHFYKKTQYREKIFDGDLDRKTQAGSFRELISFKINKTTLLIGLFPISGLSRFQYKEQNRFCIIRVI